MKKIKHKWIRILGIRIHTSNITCYVVRETLATEIPSFDRDKYPYVLRVYLTKNFPKNDRVVDLFTETYSIAEEHAKKLDKIFKTENT